MDLKQGGKELELCSEQLAKPEKCMRFNTREKIEEDGLFGTKERVRKVHEFT